MDDVNKPYWIAKRQFVIEKEQFEKNQGHDTAQAKQILSVAADNVLKGGVGKKLAAWSTLLPQSVNEWAWRLEAIGKSASTGSEFWRDAEGALQNPPITFVDFLREAAEHIKRSRALSG
jgi:hypothetical protein